MSKNRYSARHRATPPSALQTVSKAVSSHAGSIGRPAAAVVAASGLMLSAGLPANASGEVSTQPAVAAPAAAGSTTYTVQVGDTLGSIASTHGVGLESIFALNGLSWDSVIFPGDVLSVSGGPAQAAQVAAPAAASAPAAPAVTVAAPAPAAPAETSNLGITTASEAITPIAAASTAGSVSSAGIAGTAQSMVGTPYVWAGTSTSGWDCSGFTQWVYAQHGIDLPRTSQEQQAALTPTSNPQPGDLVIQNGGGHVGIYIGGGQMVSALNPSQGTLVHAVDAMPLVGYYTR